MRVYDQAFISRDRQQRDPLPLVALTSYWPGQRRHRPLSVAPRCPAGCPAGFDQGSRELQDALLALSQEKCVAGCIVLALEVGAEACCLCCLQPFSPTCLPEALRGSCLGCLKQPATAHCPP